MSSVKAAISSCSDSENKSTNKIRDKIINLTKPTIVCARTENESR